VALDLTGRMARCGLCGVEVPASEELAFFEYQGDGSVAATQGCKNCHYWLMAHNKDSVVVCGNFEPKGDLGFDKFYCGCRGFD
jgi:hypothetical protein